jgi:hypothetical protein
MVPPCKGFWDFDKEWFSWPENAFIVFKRHDLVQKSVVRFILGWNFLNKTSNLSLALGSYMWNSAKSLFCSKNSIMELNWWLFCSALLHFKDNSFFRFPKLWVLRVPLIQIPTQNGEMKNLLSKFYHRTNLMAFWFSNLGSRNKTKYSELWNSDSLGYPSCKVFWDFVKKRFYWPENCVIMLRRLVLVMKNVVRLILGWNILNKTANLSLYLGSNGK